MRQLSRELAHIVQSDNCTLKRRASQLHFIFGQGHKVESIIRKEFQDLVGVEMNPVCMIHDKIDFIRASLDGFHPSKGVLEAKLVGKEVLQKALDGEIPTHHFSQIQHQLLVTGADIAQWYGHDGKKNGALVEVRRNEDYIKHLVYAETNFWEDVQAGRVPALSEMDYLEPENTVLLQELRELKELAENAKAQYESLKENIVNVYHHNRIAGAGVKLFKTQRQGTLNVMNIPEISKAVAEAKAKLTEEYIESFRGKGTEVWNIKIT
jgi:predicted phage-related endonuclease